MPSKKENNTADRELLISRLLNAPRELVWEVFTNAEHIKNWWGPAGFTNTIFKMDVWPGGEWDFIMHGPDGTDYKNKSIYKEIIRPEKIVLDHISGPRFTITITLKEEGAKTLLTWHMLFESREQFEQVVKTFKADEGLKQNIVRLEQYITGTALPVIIERSYKAPIGKVWQALTEKDAMKQWYFDLVEFKPEVGFEFQFYGKGKEGEPYLHLCKVTAVIPEKKLQYSWRYDGYEGISFVTFELSEAGGITTVKLSHEGLETFPATANHAFARQNFAEGWTYLLDKGLKEFTENT